MRKVFDIKDESIGHLVLMLETKDVVSHSRACDADERIQEILSHAATEIHRALSRAAAEKPL